MMLSFKFGCIDNVLFFFPIVVVVCFILALRVLSSAETAKIGNRLGIVGMLAATFPSVLHAITNFVATHSISENLLPIVAVFTILLGGGIGFYVAKNIAMTSLPQLLAAFHSLVGLASVFIASAIFVAPQLFGIPETGATSFPVLNAIEISLGSAIGAITFTGSIVAFLKLQGVITASAFQYPGQRKSNMLIVLATIVMIIAFVVTQSPMLFISIIFASFIIGYLLIIPVGGADMPVVVSMLNSYSGWAAAGIGFTLENNALIVVGALVGTSGAILSSIMCKGMNRSLLTVISGIQQKNSTMIVSNKNDGHIKLCSPEDAGFIIKNAESIIIVPGYGMAVSQAQHVIRELSNILKLRGIVVRYAIHPVAGRMPGHMNVLLAEANIPYEDVLEIDEINHDFGSTDVAIVVGANDITNPAAKTDPTSPIYGMPILDVSKAKTVLFIKRSLGFGYAGIGNSLFYQNNTMMVLGDAKKIIEEILKTTKEE
ncbi:MAG: NAD(P)(+) transhydrogenase (Re/Si-specific) subunit beta [Holosporales bacterium]|jgi:NAD(P) transhydrogenase subunit beta|nr:NAD(P)(+) transhydrogenase (Re/Si-specific) subunit beta [Holosporales bacterium]